MHGVQNNRMLTHPQIVIATPHNDWLFAAIGAIPHRVREISFFAFDIDERTIAAFLVKAGEGSVKMRGIVHSIVLVHQFPTTYSYFIMGQRFFCS